MFLHFDDLAVELVCESPYIQQGWELFFNFGVTLTHGMAVGARLVARIEVMEHGKLPALPPTKPIFHDKKDGERTVTVYAGNSSNKASTVHIHFPEGAIATTPIGQATPIPTARIAILPNFHYARLEDVMMTTIATLLRPHGVFMVHAFSASFEGKSVLLVGSRGSGKTTTGLNLVTNGWTLLGNDVIVLRERESANNDLSIHALPSPGGISVRPGTAHLLPALNPHLPPLASDNKYHLHPNTFALSPSSCPLTILAFPQVTNAGKNAFVPLPRPIALALLMAESVDRWDTATLADHTNFLQKLVKQCTPYSLQLGAEVGQLAGEMEGIIQD